MPDVSRSPITRIKDEDDARGAIRRELRLMGTWIRQTRAPELGWLAPPRALWPDYAQDKRALKDEVDANDGKAAKLEVRVVEARLTPEQISKAEHLLDRVRQFPRRQAIVLVGFGCKIHMGKIAKDKHVRVSRRHAWRLLDGGCDVLAREGWSR